ncbi:Zinc finger CCCH domain-containing protein 44 [Camellia lanceoleosa]|uniref:Zinc finger CCCH domain-containing protein 44 n=1 Tax=Camellia lanceoleosa TaxID=1840588 RepID=A0ACC0HYD1_9ERIC|nr:Zinc finger CCCH domain-containing protein 44 [Camellia lanceoleosa]
MEVEKIHQMDDSQEVGVPVVVSDSGAEVKVGESGGEGKRKRGRPPRGQAKPPPAKKPKDEEDVCFICFDGGSLVLCDRRGCPKAYHPACIKRDEAFFRSRVKWNCGWHICSRCQKAAHYMCYTCTYSLCKACTKGADYLCVRENKGFCTTCMRTIMLIENNDQGNKEAAQVDFDDKSSWEYLFKVYWIYLKEKLSLTLDELTHARNPWKAAASVARKGQSLDVHYGGNDDKGSMAVNPSGHLEANNSNRTKEQPKLPNKGDSLSMDKSISDSGNTSVGSTKWASKELLEFVAHMRNGDTSVLSQFEVQGLLLDHIKTNNLRDPNQKSQIICDLRLGTLFGKPHVDHTEMLKLLESHFLTKEDSQKIVIRGNVVDSVVSQVEGDGNNDNLLIMGKDTKSKTRRKGEESGPQTNLDEYAAIDVHNINLIYLRRDLMESLIVDNGKFHDKVVGSIVRIRIFSSDQKQDVYRLVQVVGTCKVAPYKIGERTADATLEILNLDKKEAISIDAISNQEFSEDECRGLRQSIKCGLVKQFTVGQVQEKAMALQEVRLNDYLETEEMRLSHLRDQASEKGHKNEFRECVEKIELLMSPEERQRRLNEIPEVHVDPNCESDDDAGVHNNKKQDEDVKPRYFEGKDACGSNTVEKPGNQVDSSGSVVGGWNNQAGLRSGSFSGVGSETSAASLSTGSAPSANDSETDRLWYYRDPHGNVQGPFCMVQLRKWSTTGLFPPDMKIWGINDEEGDSLLLTDVLNGQFCKVSPLRYISLPSQEVKGASDSSLYYGNKEFVKSVNNNNVQTGSSFQSGGSVEVKNSYSDQLQVHCPVPSSAFTEQPHETSLHQARGHESQRWNLDPNLGNWSSHGNATGGQSHENQSNCHGYSGQSSGQSSRPLPVNYSSYDGDSSSGFASVARTITLERIFGIDILNRSSPTPNVSDGDLEGQTTKEQQLEPSNVPVKDSYIQNQPSLTLKLSDGDEKVDSNNQNIPNPPPKPADEDEKVRATENKQSVSSNFPVQDSNRSWSSASSLVVGGRTRVPNVADEWGRAKPSAEEWDSGLVSVSSLKPREVPSDHAATPTSRCDDLTPPFNASSWQALVTEPIEFSTLAEESVSDLLAEVDAMESQCGLASPTSVTNSGEELFQDSKIDCFTSLRGLSPPPLDSGKSDALSSTGDIKLPPPPAMTGGQFRASHSNVLDPVKRSGVKTSTITKLEVETKPNDVPVKQSKTMRLDMIDTDTARRSGVKPTDAGVNSGWGGSTQGTTNMARGTGQGTARGNTNSNRSPSAGYTGRESHSKHSGERFSPRDRAFHSGDSGFGKGRPSWSRQSYGSGGGGGGGGGGSGSYSRPPPKGQRVCKFYESGRCKKGAFCDYLHP